MNMSMNLKTDLVQQNRGPVTNGGAGQAKPACATNCARTTTTSARTPSSCCATPCPPPSGRPRPGAGAVSPAGSGRPPARQPAQDGSPHPHRPRGPDAARLTGGRPRGALRHPSGGRLHLEPARHGHRHAVDQGPGPAKQGSAGVLAATGTVETARPCALPGFDCDHGGEFLAPLGWPICLAVKSPRPSPARGPITAATTPRWSERTGSGRGHCWAAAGWKRRRWSSRSARCPRKRGTAEELLSARTPTQNQVAGEERLEAALRTGAHRLSTADGPRGVGVPGAAGIARALREAGPIRVTA